MDTRGLFGFNIRPRKFLHRYKSHLIDWSPQFTFPRDIYTKKTITVHNDLDNIKSINLK